MNTLIEVGGSFKSSRLGLWCRPAQLAQISVMNTNGESKSVFPLGCFSAAVAELAGGGAYLYILNANSGNTESILSKPHPLREHILYFSYPGHFSTRKWGFSPTVV